MNLCYIDWHVTPSGPTAGTRSGSRPPSARCPSAPRAGRSRVRSRTRRLFRQSSLWEDKADFDTYWNSEEVSAMREEALPYYAKPVLPVWHNLIVGE